MIEVTFYRRLPALVIVGASSYETPKLVHGVTAALGSHLPRTRVVVELTGQHAKVDGHNRGLRIQEIGLAILDKMKRSNPRHSSKRNPAKGDRVQLKADHWTGMGARAGTVDSVHAYRTVVRFDDGTLKDVDNRALEPEAPHAWRSLARQAGRDRAQGSTSRAETLAWLAREAHAARPNPVKRRYKRNPGTPPQGLSVPFNEWLDFHWNGIKRMVQDRMPPELLAQAARAEDRAAWHRRGGDTRHAQQEESNARVLRYAASLNGILPAPPRGRENPRGRRA